MNAMDECLQGFRRSHLVGAMVGASWALTSAVTWADEQPLLACSDHGFVLQDCTLRPLTLSEGVVHQGQSFEAEYIVSYAFPCQGHAVDLGLASGSSRAMFVQGTVGASLHLTGTGPLRTFDPAPAVTRTLSFLPGCGLQVRSVTTMPSARTVSDWRREARLLAALIDRSVLIYALAQDYREMHDWTVDNLELFKQALTRLVQHDPTNIHYARLLHKVMALLEHHPTSVPIEELGPDAEVALRNLREQLVRDAARGSELLTRMVRWQIEVESVLSDALGRVPR